MLLGSNYKIVGWVLADGLISIVVEIKGFLGVDWSRSY